jgi:hypothetical protein
MRILLQYYYFYNYYSAEHFNKRDEKRREKTCRAEKGETSSSHVLHLVISHIKCEMRTGSRAYDGNVRVYTHQSYVINSEC